MKTLFMFALTTFGLVTFASTCAVQLFAQDQVFEPVQPVIPQSALQQGDVVVQPESPDKRPDSERPVFGALFVQSDQGVKVQSVFTNGPMYLQEIFTDDLIQKLDKVEVKTQKDISEFLLQKKIDDLVVVTRLREGVAKELSVKLISQAKLLEVSNTSDDAQANISRQYVGQAPPFYEPDVLQKVDRQLESMQKEIESLRSELDLLRKEALERQKKSKMKDGDT